MTDIKPMGDMWLAAHHLPANLKLYPESALLQAREEGRLAGVREAAEICNDNPYLNGVDCAEIITRAAEGK